MHQRCRYILADRTATWYDGYWHHHDVRLSVCLCVCKAVHCGSRGRCTGLKVMPACC